MSLLGSTVMLLVTLYSGTIVQLAIVLGSAVKVLLTVWLSKTSSSATFSLVPFQRYLTVQLA